MSGQQMQPGIQRDLFFHSQQHLPAILPIQHSPPVPDVADCQELMQQESTHQLPSTAANEIVTGNSHQTNL